MECKFIADIHLGKLARLLRMLGFDTVYKNNFTKEELIQISDEQKRILLSRNSSLLKKANCFLITNENPFTQLRETVNHFNIYHQFLPFLRCIACNGKLAITPKAKVVDLLENNTLTYFDEFWQCRDCKRIYWKGSHYEKMTKTIADIFAQKPEFSLASNKNYMTTKEIAQRLIDLCRQGKWEQAQTELFSGDVVSIEPHASPAFEKETKGLNAIIEKGHKFETMTEQLHSVSVSEPIVVGNSIAFKLTMDITMKQKPRESWEEICIYQVKDGKIISEQFFI